MKLYYKYVSMVIIVLLFIIPCKSDTKEMRIRYSLQVAGLPDIEEVIKPVHEPSGGDTPENQKITAPSDFKINNDKNEGAIQVDSKKENININIPILYYHCVDDKISGMEELYVSPTEFEKQMEYLKNNNYNPVTFEQMGELEEIENPVIITFDDGYEDNFLKAYPILKKFNFKATIFISTGFINKKNMLKDYQMKEMSDLISFQSHTVSHPDLRGISSLDLENELAESKRILEEFTGREVNTFAYPIGLYNSNVVKMTQKYYKYAVTTDGGLYNRTQNDYEIKRVYIPRDLDIKGFERKIKGEVYR